jgi:hypothetical protein
MQRLPDEKLARTAAMRAINRAMTAGKTQAQREIAENYAIRVGTINAKVKTSNATVTSLSSKVTWRGSALNLTDFKTSPTAPQPARRTVLRAMVEKSSGMQSYHPAFLIRTGNAIKAYRRATSNDGRYPITGVWGPSIPQLLSARSVRDAVEERANAVLHDRLDHEVNRLLIGGSGNA